MMAHIRAKTSRQELNTITKHVLFVTVTIDTYLWLGYSDSHANLSSDNDSTGSTAPT